DGRISVVFGKDDRYLELPQERDERRRLEAVVTDLDDVTQGVSIESLRQQFEKAAEIGFFELLIRRELPEEGAEARPQLCHSGIEKAFDRIASFLDHPTIDRVARTFGRKHKC